MTSLADRAKFVSNSSKNLVSVTMKAAVGVAFTIMRHSGSRAAYNLPFPLVIGQKPLPLRSQRHMPNSIATLRIRHARALLHALPQCPCCRQMRR